MDFFARGRIEPARSAAGDHRSPVQLAAHAYRPAHQSRRGGYQPPASIGSCRTKRREQAPALRYRDNISARSADRRGRRSLQILIACAHRRASVGMRPSACAHSRAPIRVRPSACTHRRAPIGVHPSACAHRRAPVGVRPSACTRRRAPIGVHPSACAHRRAPILTL